MTESHESQPAPLNRAARRAKRKGEAGTAPLPETHKNDQPRHSQVPALPKFKGRRGNR